MLTTGHPCHCDGASVCASSRSPSCTRPHTLLNSRHTYPASYTVTSDTRNRCPFRKHKRVAFQSLSLSIRNPLREPFNPPRGDVLEISLFFHLLVPTSLEGVCTLPPRTPLRKTAPGTGQCGPCLWQVRWGSLVMSCVRDRGVEDYPECAGQTKCGPQTRLGRRHCDGACWPPKELEKRTCQLCRNWPGAFIE